MRDLEKNKAWSDAVIRRIDPAFRHRWEVFADGIEAILTPDSVWVDVGCGENEMVERYGHLAQYAVGVDPLEPRRHTAAPFIKGDISHLPFADESVDLVTLRFVVEHLARIPEDFAEIERVLKPGGRLLVVTTNRRSPFVAGMALLPYRLKNLLIRTLLRVSEEEIFPTYHRFNTVRSMRRGAGSLALSRLELIQDANFTRRWLFLLLFTTHLVTGPKFLRWVRPNIVAEFVKERGERRET